MTDFVAAVAAAGVVVAVGVPGVVVVVAVVDLHHLGYNIESNRLPTLLHSHLPVVYLQVHIQHLTVKVIKFQ